jgi:hypothetical protein
VGQPLKVQIPKSLIKTKNFSLEFNCCSFKLNIQISHFCFRIATQLLQSLPQSWSCPVHFHSITSVSSKKLLELSKTMGAAPNHCYKFLLIIFRPRSMIYFSSPTSNSFLSKTNLALSSKDP